MAKDSQGRESTSIRIDPELWHQFDIECRKRHLNRVPVMEDLIRGWMGQPPEPEVPPHLRRAVDLMKRNFTDDRMVDAFVRAMKEGLIFGGGLNPSNDV